MKNKKIIEEIEEHLAKLPKMELGKVLSALESRDSNKHKSATSYQECLSNENDVYKKVYYELHSNKKKSKKG